ncbi:hypothetical protein SCB71_18750 [Herbiconiux sp. KACC 21604]|uniref:hypothetical protein n=1 Tax=unclassified Herbiconiux TaxID=2618217 RepID=UPI0014930975|nr:hypothetical protein [Herbiconiux sp. SALV-R1]QJU55090.1 hypothetical protein HL652_16690 [Herbiconiux sp. SALV-R1]WPO86236.1 hypothetical protein SCB71_18750 [Herbiconiux sp. KACC 21604]
MADAHDAAERLLVDLLADSAVRSVRFVTGPLPVAVWLVVENDAEAQELRSRSDIEDIVSRALRRAGLPSRDVEGFRVVVQSEETVTRDYEGSWFYALR